MARHIITEFETNLVQLFHIFQLKNDSLVWHTCVYTQQLVAINYILPTVIIELLHTTEQDRRLERNVPYHQSGRYLQYSMSQLPSLVM